MSRQGEYAEGESAKGKRCIQHWRRVYGSREKGMESKRREMERRGEKGEKEGEGGGSRDGVHLTLVAAFSGDTGAGGDGRRREEGC